MKRLIQCWLLGLALLHGGVGASELASRLKAGQHVLLMRHAYAPGVGDPPGYSLDRCDSQRRLNDEGRRQAAGIGNWLRAQGIAKAQVFSSPWCRCTETAQLLGLGPVTVEPSLASFFDRTERSGPQTKALQNFIAKAMRSPDGAPLILVTHQVNISEFVGQAVGTGDMVLARVTAQGKLVDYQRYPSP